MDPSVVARYKSFKEVGRYLAVSGLVYLYLLGAMYCLVDMFQMNRVSSYVAVYLSAYVLEYASTLWLVFREAHQLRKVVKYITYVICFLFISTAIFKILIAWPINYLAATVLTAILLMPLRFIVNKLWVYR